MTRIVGEIIPHLCIIMSKNVERAGATRLPRIL